MVASGEKGGRQRRALGAFLGVGCSLCHQPQAEAREVRMPRRVGFPAETQQPEITASQPTPAAQHVRHLAEPFTRALSCGVHGASNTKR